MSMTATIAGLKEPQSHQLIICETLDTNREVPGISLEDDPFDGEILRHNSRLWHRRA